MIARRACRGSCVGCKSLENAGGTPATTEESGVTIIEMLVVIMVIFILAALVLAASSYVQNKGARARAETEIAAMSAALESYKADNGIYASSANTISLTATGPVNNNPVTGTYATASLDLYTLLSGDTAHDGSAPTGKSYMQFKPQMLGRSNRSAPVGTSNKISSICDPFGYSYGYSTSKNPDVNPNASSASGYNPTYDLWSTANDTAGTTQKWIKNW